MSEAGEALDGDGDIWVDNEELVTKGGPPPRRAWIAVLLALLSPIAGVLYAGAPRWVLPFLAAQIIMAVWLLIGGTSSFIGFFGYLALLFAQGLAGMIVAGIMAIKNRQLTQLAPYQRYWLYLLIIVGFGVGQRVAATVEGPAAVGVKSSSMFPTIWSSDLVLATGGPYNRYEPARGDIVVYWHPKQPGERWIKRIVALAGDRLSLEDGLIV
ncbi:MAG: signal peptidase I, partial [Pseudomonadota bacterium]